MSEDGTQNDEIVVSFSKKKIVISAIVLALILVAMFVVKDLPLVTDTIADIRFSQISRDLYAPYYAQDGEKSLVPAPDINDHLRGSKDAVITLIEYSDLECPFCKSFHPIMKELLQKYDGQINWVYRHFPSPSHKDAFVKSEATECVAEQGGNDKFWEFTDAIFESPDVVKLSDLPEMVEQIGLDRAEFMDCVQSRRYVDLVKKDLDEGGAAGVTGTPGTFIFEYQYGRRLLFPGEVPIETMVEYIDRFLVEPV